jgi:hypothetical protein
VTGASGPTGPSGPAGPASFILFNSEGTVTTAGKTQYFGLGTNLVMPASMEANIQQIISGPAGGTGPVGHLTSFYCFATNKPGSGDTDTCTLRDNKADVTGATCTVTNAGNSCNVSISPTVAFNAGDLLDTKIQTGATATQVSAAAGVGP